MGSLKLGPVLSFRGVADDGTWQVSALVGLGGLASGEPAPEMTVDGRIAPPPLPLLSHRGRTYWRYDLSCAPTDQDRRVRYGLAGVKGERSFTVPARGAAPRMAYVSCNGFSDPSGIRKLIQGENAVWEDLLSNHDKACRREGYQLDKEQLWHEQATHDVGHQRFHLLLMGGDQIYFDSIWEDLKSLKQWIGLPREQQLTYPVSAALEAEIADYYLTLYADRWLPAKREAWGTKVKSRDAAEAMARTPTVMMWDDHDIFDGWGSYSPEMQRSPLFQCLFRHARRAFWVFQMQHAIDRLPPLALRTDINVRTDDPLFKPIAWQTVLAGDPLALPLLDRQPGFSFTHALGPLQLVVADLRTERSGDQVLGPDTWSALQRWLEWVPLNERDQDRGCQHLLFMSSVPVVHPKLSLAEAFMDSFGADHVLDSSADDLKDHWTHNAHEGERKRLIETLLRIAHDKRLRVTLLSGDVHVAAWGVAHRKDVGPQDNWAQIQQLTSTAVVHPSLVSVTERLFFHVLNTVAQTPQPLDVHLSAEMMLFPGSNRHLMAARNWLAIELDGGKSANGAKLWATWRCETKDGFSNHLLATEPVHQGAAGGGGVAVGSRPGG